MRNLLARIFPTLTLCAGIIFGATIMDVAHAREIDTGVRLEAPAPETMRSINAEPVGLTSPGSAVSPESHQSGFHCHGPTLHANRRGATVTCYKVSQTNVKFALRVDCYGSSALTGFPTIKQSAWYYVQMTVTVYCDSAKPFAFLARVVWVRL